MKITQYSLLKAIPIMLALNACQAPLTSTSGTIANPGVPPSQSSGIQVSPVASPTPPLREFASCRGSDPNVQCIGLKLVAYQDGLAPPVIQKMDAETLVAEINHVWEPCGIAFQLDQFQIVNPTELGLAYSPNWRADSTRIRSTFDDSLNFLVVAVGPWNSSTIAVTQMPGYGPFGTLVDQQYAKNPLTVAHELGHYMGLYHFRSSRNLMSPYIGSDTRELTADQCSVARATNLKYWLAMFR